MTQEERLAEMIRQADKGCMPYYDVIPSLIRERGYRRGIEIGVFVGGHAKSILENSDIKLLVGIDPFVMYEQNPPGIESQADYDFIHDFILDRLDVNRYLHLRMTSDEAFVLLLETGLKFDFVFIDGLHTYSQVKKELILYDSLIRTGGVIACHDYDHPFYPSLTKAIDEFTELHDAQINICPFHAVYIDKTW